MNKILLIIQREYLTRVRKRSFLLTTFLVPIFFIAMYVGIIYLTKKSFDDTHAIVYVVDQEGNIANKLQSNKNVTYITENKDLQTQINSLNESKENTSVLLIPKGFYDSKNVEFISSGKINVSTQKDIDNELSNILKNHHFEKIGLNLDSINNFDSEVTISTKEIGKDGNTKESNTEISMVIAIVLSILIYLSLFLYGSQVMRSIIEEKSSRIIEVIISSVKPFQLMVGKIVGVGLVGLTQFFLWLVLTIILAIGASTFLVSKQELQKQMMGNAISQHNIESLNANNNNMQFEQANEIMNIVDSINITEIVVCFFVFFLGGYLLYSALFAAVGSAIDSETEASQFTMPITMPLLLTYALSFGVLINDPHGNIATWLSIIPFTSPIAMLVRIPFGVPLWQIILSASLLVVTFIITTWAASRIYRVGILMYGKKASFKELIKWFNYKS